MKKLYFMNFVHHVNKSLHLFSLTFVIVKWFNCSLSNTIQCHLLISLHEIICPSMSQDVLGGNLKGMMRLLN